MCSRGRVVSSIWRAYSRDVGDLAQDRVTLQTPLSEFRKAVFVLGRKGAGPQFDYGTSSEGLIRFALEGGCP